MSLSNDIREFYVNIIVNMDELEELLRAIEEDEERFDLSDDCILVYDNDLYSRRKCYDMIDRIAYHHNRIAYCMDGVRNENKNWKNIKYMLPGDRVYLGGKLRNIDTIYMGSMLGIRYYGYSDVD